MNSLIVIPTYNERKNIAGLINEIYKLDKAFHILVVDDNSPDDTAGIIKQLKRSKYSDCLYLKKRSGKMGLASAYLDGFRWALERDYDYIFEMDADYSHHPRYLPDFLTALQDNDLVLGSRYIEGGGIEGWGPIRKFISRGGSYYARTILNLPIQDLTGGYKGFHRRVLETIDLDDVRSEGYSFQIELTYRTYLHDFQIKEIPILFVDRTAGSSKMSRKIFLEAIYMVWWLRFNLQKIGSGRN